MIFGYKLIYKTKGHSPENADIWSGKGMFFFIFTTAFANFFVDVYDRDEKMWKEKEAREKAEGKNKGGWFYRVFVSWLF